MKISPIKFAKNVKIDETMKFLQERNYHYANRQANLPAELRNPASRKVSILKNFLVLIGVLPIKRPNIK